MGPGGFFPTNPDLADILGRTDLDFENLFFDFFGISNSQISRSPDFQVPRNLAWARLGSGLGQGWVGPSGGLSGGPSGGPGCSPEGPRYDGLSDLNQTLCVSWPLHSRMRCVRVEADCNVSAM